MDRRSQNSLRLKSSFFPVVFLVIYAFTIVNFAKSVPIEIINRHSESHGRSLPQSQQTHPRQPPNQHHNFYQQPQQQQARQVQSPEKEDSVKSNMNHKQFRRNAIPPPDVKVSPTSFHRMPTEQFSNANNDRGNIYRQFEKDQQQQFSKKFRHGQVSNPQFQAQRVGSKEHLNSNRHSYQPIPHSTPLDKSHQTSHGENLHSQLNPNLNNEIERNDCTENQNCEAHSVPRHLNQKFQGWMLNQPQRMFETPLTPPPVQSPTNYVFKAYDANNNGTFFIEYDVSDNDVTYETTMEVEDHADTSSNNEKLS